MSRFARARPDVRGIRRAWLAAWSVTLYTLLSLAGIRPAPASQAPGAPVGQPIALTVQVRSADGHGVAGVVIIAEPDVEQHDHRAVRTAIMDQKNMRFVPEILVVQTGSAVEFPNSDQIEHQVYSLSPAKRFELSLYRGHKYPPVVFDRAGLVTLGCNIHDFMIGYIYVTDSPYFGRTDSAGQVVLQGLAAGGYTLIAWHPGMREHTGTSVRRHISIAAGEAASQVFVLEHPLHREMNPMGHRRWADY